MIFLHSALRDWFPIIVSAVLAAFLWVIRWWRRQPLNDPPTGTPYKVYTSDFDIEIRAEDIAGRLTEISIHHPQYWRPEGDPDWIAAVESANRKAQEIINDGLLETLPTDFSDAAISMLIDHSGSMRGEPMQAVAATAKAITETLTAKGTKVELLGFTTAGWQGGYARRHWIECGRPRYPGRLCALMHIVYKAADDEGLSGSAFEAMLNPGIVYENIDGEAIEWAETRLLARPEKKKLLLVISDGAPVDDSTLKQNGPSILCHHIKEVIARIETQKNINLGAVGINYRVDGFYVNSAAAEDISDLPVIMSGLLEKMLSTD